MTDGQIVDLFWERSESAIRETETKYGQLCFSLVYRIVQDRLDAEECVNDGYLRLWNAIPPKRPQKLRPFLAKIVRNLVLNRYEREHTAKRGGGEVTLAEGDWRFEILFDESSLLTREQELLDKPFRLRATRYWDEHGFPVEIRVTSLRLRALSATLCYDKPLTGFWHGITVGDIYVVLKDGTMILADWDMGHSKGDHWQGTLVFPVPVPWEDVDHVLLPDGKRLAVG